MRSVAAFDFDGTLSRRDTLIPFLVNVSGRAKFAAACAQVGVSGARKQVALGDRDAIKERLIELLFTGRHDADLRRRGEVYARDLLANELRPDVLARLEQHRDAGHEIVLVSASLVHYLDPLADTLGLDAVMAVEPEVVDGRLTGRLARPNVRAEQKAVRLREWLGVAPDGPLDDVELWSYGNSSGDHALLELADHAAWLGRPSTVPVGVQLFTPGPLEPEPLNP